MPRALGDGRSTARLRRVLDRCLDATDGLLALANHLPGQLGNVRFAMEAGGDRPPSPGNSASSCADATLWRKRVALTKAQYVTCCARGIGHVLLQRALRGAARWRRLVLAPGYRSSSTASRATARR